MAHVGKFYKLQFRRDLAFNFFNVDAYPEAAFGSTPNLRGTVGSGFAGRRFLLVNLLKDSQPPMVWSGGGFIVNGVSLSIQVQVFVDPDSISYGADLLIKDEGTTATLFHAHSIPAVSNIQPSNYGLVFGRPFIDTPQITSSGNEVSWQMTAARWVDYNP